MERDRSCSQPEMVKSLIFKSFDQFCNVEQIDIVQPGKTVIIRNSKIDMFKGFMRLAVDRWGKVEPSTETAKFEVNSNNNLSNVEYELVTVNEND